MSYTRASGILLHPTSLPGRFGIGDLGSSAYRFVDFLVDSQQTLWQILPLGPVGHGNSPYMAYSAMAGNPLLISLEILQEQGLFAPDELILTEAFPDDSVSYDRAGQFKLAQLKKAAERFKTVSDDETKQAFEDFRTAQASWLEDYALFMALKEANEGKTWTQWEEAIARRRPEALNQAKVDLAPAIFLHEYMQFEFYRQWSALRAFANERGIRIVGDMPIYVAHDSVDVWANPEDFLLDEETLEAKQMAGVPPDFFSDTGQLWGNPIYNWEKMEADGFKWWLKRIRGLMTQVDFMRIDHFRGFAAYWAVPAGEETAANGQWIDAPGVALFETVIKELGELPFWAEDLGHIDQPVLDLRDRFKFPGMKVLLFAFGGDHHNPYLPFNADRNCVIYTGTHDNNTAVGWFNHASDHEKWRLASYVGAFNRETVHWDLIRLAMSSVAKDAIVPLQDLFGLGGEARMNIPGTGESNWEWRYSEAMLAPTVGRQLRQLTELYGRGRDQNAPPPEQD